MQQILAIIQSQLAQKFPLEPDTPLLSSGLIDSFGVAGLLTALEREFHVRIDPIEVGVDSFDTAEQIQHYVETLRGDPMQWGG
jgi:acyl carrier protein